MMRNLFAALAAILLMGPVAVADENRARIADCYRECLSDAKHVVPATFIRNPLETDHFAPMCAATQEVAFLLRGCAVGCRDLTEQLLGKRGAADNLPIRKEFYALYKRYTAPLKLAGLLASDPSETSPTYGENAIADWTRACATLHHHWRVLERNIWVQCYHVVAGDELRERCGRN